MPADYTPAEIAEYAAYVAARPAEQAADPLGIGDYFLSRRVEAGEGRTGAGCT